MNYTYFFINLGTIIIPLLFSFHPKLQFYKKWKSTVISIILVAIPFLIWDVLFTRMGIWGFNPIHLSNFYFVGLPIEEWMFFITIPYACLFTYHSLKQLIPPFKFPYTGILIAILLALITIVGLLCFDKYYTFTTFISLFFFLMYFHFKLNLDWLNRFYLSAIILVVPFLVVNGILTGTGIEHEVVWYNSNENMDIRLLTIPIEDFAYGFLLLLLNTFLFEKFKWLNQ